MALRAMLLALLSSFTAASENFTDCGTGVGMNQLTCCDQSDFNVTSHIAHSTHCHGLVTSFDFKSDADCRKVFGIPDAYKMPSIRPKTPSGEGRCVAPLPLVEGRLHPGNPFARNGVLHTSASRVLLGLPVRVFIPLPILCRCFGAPAMLPCCAGSSLIT